MHDFVFLWNRQEHARGIKAVTRHMIGGWWLRKGHFFVIGIALVGILPLLFASADRRMAYLASVTPWLIILGLWFGLLKWGLPWLAARQVAKHDPSVRGEIHHLVRETGFAVKSAAALVDLTWGHILQVVETPEFFLFYHTRNCAYPTPKRVIPPAELTSLRAALRQYIGDRAKLAEPLPSAS